MVSAGVDVPTFWPGTFSLYLDNRRPISAVQLGSLLTAIGNDYARFSGGGELALVDAQSGSIRLKWAARIAAGALAVMTPVNTVVDFAERIGQALAAVEHRPASLNSRSPGTKTAREILEIATASGSSFRLDYQAPDGERLVIQMDANEAERIHHQSVGEALASRKVAAPPTKKDVRVGTSAELGALTDAVARLSEGPVAGAEEQSTVIAALVDALLQSGSSYAVEQFAAQLEAKGRYDLSVIVREELGRRSRTEPRLRH